MSSFATSGSCEHGGELARDRGLPGSRRPRRRARRAAGQRTWTTSPATTRLPSTTSAPSSSTAVAVPSNGAVGELDAHARSDRLAQRAVVVERKPIATSASSSRRIAAHRSSRRVDDPLDAQARRSEVVGELTCCVPDVHADPDDDVVAGRRELAEDPADLPSVDAHVVRPLRARASGADRARDGDPGRESDERRATAAGRRAAAPRT